ncbi:hypothetical protein GPECTOR_11g104 [Gonium pectorale]|uniref:Uncharacterized protein n=1 Tax=Gonium pectorale TaxID=33097 RepID=A0A150GQM6_GONPE|nr:hypothetical protein GPECTOR_11g104 [Gonium pectorale]|eukprot:KXZ51650.1 hypothetical protein GPECTOR_11g104 [Gonium pectorale]
MKDNAGPIRRFPAGFWASFNHWHGEFAKLGQRPSSKTIFRWHTENAHKVWGDSAVSYAETQRHANRMKCRRTGLPQRLGSNGDEDDDEDYVPDAADFAETCVRGLAASIRYGGADNSGQVDDRAAEGAAFTSAMRGGELRAQAELRAPAFNDNSDPPGRLLGYMGADSELPAPAAAPNRDIPTSKRHATMANAEVVKTEAVWMQPDPVGPTSFPPAQLSQRQASDAAGAVANMGTWDSTVSIYAPYGLSAAAGSSAAAHDSPASDGSQPLAAAVVGRQAPQAAARHNPDSDCQAGFTDSNVGELTRQHLSCLPQHPSQPPTPSPFADMALAPAGSHEWPVTRATAALLRGANSSALAPMLDGRGGPVWLRTAGAELDTLLSDMGILANVAAVQQVLVGSSSRPSALTTNAPLRLPPPRPKRDLSALLRTAGSAQQAAPAAVEVLAGRSSKRLNSAWPSLRGCSVSSAAAAAALARPLGGSEWAVARPSDGLRLTAIDCMPLDALL